MKTPYDHRANPAPIAPALDAVEHPISLTVQVVIADARKRTQLVEAGCDQSFAASPEALASLPGQLHRLMQGAEADALRGMSQFLAQLVQPEPAPPATPLPKPAMEPVLKLVPSASGMQMVLVTEPHYPPVRDDYLLPVNLPLTDAPPLLPASAPESPAGGE